MKIKFNEYWFLIQEDALICQLLDPRFKTLTLEGSSRKKEVRRMFFLK
jgi:hypothetical protein